MILSKYVYEEIYGKYLLRLPPGILIFDRTDVRLVSSHWSYEPRILLHVLYPRPHDI